MCIEQVAHWKYKTVLIIFLLTSRQSTLLLMLSNGGEWVIIYHRATICLELTRTNTE